MQTKKSIDEDHVKRSALPKTTLISAIICLILGFFIGFMFRGLITDSKENVRKYTVSQQIDQGKVHSSQKVAAPITELEDAVVANPKNSIAWVKLGNAYFDSRQFQKAINAYQKYLELNPDNPDVWTDMGIMYRRTGNSKEALICFDQAIKINPSHQQSRFNKGIVLLHDFNRIPEAIKAWQELVEINPGAKTPDGRMVKELIQTFRGVKE